MVVVYFQFLLTYIDLEDKHDFVLRINSAPSLREFL